ncbi:hybrid sensor histidine kinase/response regulator [Myxosarcina sp. GI1]|uniref:ATP-binding response regulator n=1 Tax=Myxosarcina sp. GI1 TaxID=1541065 RepID=UPI00056D0541|nr:HAMP domain-containing sensor histidine kinase [Myxosarcina sp. GI1]
MSDGSGSSVQQQTKLKQFERVKKVLILATHTAEAEAIATTLRSSSLNCQYHVCVTVKQARKALVDDAYNVMLYDYSADGDRSIKNPLQQLGWWYELSPQIPLVLVTDTLGDEIAVECIQAGVGGYVLRHRLDKLPNIIENLLANFSWQKSQLQFVTVGQQQKRIEQLEAENQRLRAAETAIQEHISHLAHELRSPVAGIVGFARMLRDCIYGALNTKQMQYICSITSTGEYLLELVNNYLDLAKIEADKEEIHIERLVVEEVCYSALSIIRPRVKEKNLELNFGLGKDVDFCFADPIRLKQILLNLLSNAVKFTAAGSVTLKVEKKDEMLTFAVIDTGIGIAPSDCDKLFQAFQQLNSWREGTGLGLVLSRKLARLHGGDITIGSEVGKGSCFTLHLPSKFKKVES